MAVRSVSVRYAASVGSLVSDLGRAAQANDRVGTAAEKAAVKAQRAAARQAQAARDAAKAAEQAQARATAAVAQAATRQDAASQRAAASAVRNAERAGNAQVRAAERAQAANQQAAEASAAASQQAADAAESAAEKSANVKAGIGVALAAGVAVSVAKFAEFDAQMSAVAAATNATSATMTSLRDAAVEAGARTQYSATEAAAGITELSKAGVDAADIIGGGLTGALNLAASGQMDVAEAAETMATALSQFGLGGDQGSHVADLLAAAAGKAQGSVSDMGFALKQAGLVAHGTGLSIEETTAGLAAFASKGLIGSDAGTSFKSMLQRLTPQGDKAAAMIDELGISAYDAQGNFVGLEKYAGILSKGLAGYSDEQRNAAFSTIFGSDAVRAANVLYEEGATGIHHWTEETNQQGFAAEQASKLTDNLKGDVERLGGSIDTALIQGGSGANDMLRGLTTTAGGLVDGLAAIPGPVLLGVTALTSLTLLGPKVGLLAARITGPLTSSVTGFNTRLAMARNQLVPFGPQLQNAGNQSLTAAQRIRTVGTAMGGLKGAASGAMGVLGGPWGVAMLAATVGIGMWAQGQAEAKAAADALSATIDKQTGKFTDSSKTTVRDAIMGALSGEDQQLLQKLGVDFDALAEAALKGGPAFEDQKQHLVNLMNEHQMSDGIFSQEGRALEGLVSQYTKTGDAAEDTRIKQEVLNKINQDAAVANSRHAESAATAERNTSDLGIKIGETGTAAAGATGAMGDYGTAVEDTGGKAKDAADELQGMLDRFDLLAGGRRALAAADRNIHDATDEAVKAAKDKGGNDPEAVKAAAKAKENLARAEADLAKARGKGGKSKSTKGDANAVANAELSLKHALEHQRTVQANSKATATQLESARQRVETATQRLSQARGKGAGTTAKADTTAEERRVADAKDALVAANKRVADSYVAPQKAQEAYEAKQASLAVSGEAKMAELQKQTKPLSDIRDAYDQTRTALILAAEARGIHGKALDAELKKYLPTRTELKKLLDEYEATPAYQDTQIRTPGLPEAKKAMHGYWEVIDGFPKFIETTATADTADAKAEVHGYWEVIDGFPKWVPTTFKPFVNTSSADAVEARMDQLARQRTALITIDAGLTAGAADLLGGIGGLGHLVATAATPTPKGHRAGGPISGPGTATSDSIPALLSNGEHVLTADDVVDAGGHDAIFRMRRAIQSGRLRFRDGGPVDVLGARPNRRARLGPVAAQAFAAGGPVRSQSGGAGIDYGLLAAALAGAPRSDGPVHLHAHSLDIGDGLRRAARDYFWDRDHRR